MTSKEFASLLGVSQSTISRALNDSDLLSTETKEYIRAKAAEYGFVLNSHARTLKTNRTGTIGILFPKHFVGMHANLGLAYLYDLVQEKLKLQGYDVMVIYDALNPNGTSLFELSVKCHKVDGFIILTLDLDSKNLELIQKHNIPCVYLLNAIKADTHSSSCISDSEHGGYLVGQYLGKFKDYTPYYISADETADSRTRCRGYIRGLKENGRSLEPEHILSCGLSIRSAFECIMENRSIFENGKNSIFAYNDILALGAVNACTTLGLKIPEQVQIVGMDGLPLISELSPRITTVKLFQNDIAEMGCDLLQKAIEKKENKVIQMAIKPEFVMGSTSLPI